MIKKTIVCLLLGTIVSASWALTKVANDPTRLGVGARILGMGKSYIGMADDLEGIFTNPAALSQVFRPQVTTMSGKFLNEYNYLNFGTAVPTRFGSFGFGYVGNSVAFTAPGATIEAVDGIRIIPTGGVGSNYEYNNRVFLLSWGATVGDFPVGGTLKFFGVDMTGQGITDGSAAGNDLDLGINYRPLSSTKFGLVLQNILPSSWGGKITWKNGLIESLPHVLKLGASVDMVGERGLWQLGKHEVKFNFDGDFTPMRQNIPALYHTGLEWSPVDLLSVRAGVDQETVGSGTSGALEPANNLTFGLGLNLNDFRFDYAFHQYNQTVDNDTHYFSISYGVSQKENIPKGLLFTFEPGDKAVIRGETAAITGKVLKNEIVHLTFNGVETPLTAGKINTRIALKPGKNKIEAKAYTEKWTLVGTQQVQLLSLKTFSDVSAEYWASAPIENLATLGIISGYPNGTFSPEAGVSRAELCSLLMRIKGIEIKPGWQQGFMDVPATHWAAQSIIEAVNEGLAKGYPDSTFRPNGKVTRAEGIVILSRFDRLPASILSELPSTDVAGRFWAFNEIAAAKDAGWLQFLDGKPFEPNRPMSRAEIAFVLAKTSQMSAKIRALNTW
jgi:hypothetical protein